MRWKTVVLLVCMAGALCACDKLKEKFGDRPEPTKTILVLFDLSGSTKNAQRQKYDAIFSRLLERVGVGDAIVAAKITGSSVTEPEIPVKEEFSQLQLTGNALKNKVAAGKAKEELCLRKEAITATVKEVLFSQDSKKSDIMGALHLADKIFKSYQHDRSILIVMSDMLEDSQAYNFSKEKLTQEKAKAILETEKKANRLPDLTNVKVYVVAAGSLDTEKFFAVQRFWLEYFAACGAIAEPANYANDLLRFSE